MLKRKRGEEGKRRERRGEERGEREEEGREKKRGERKRGEKRRENIKRTTTHLISRPLGSVEEHHSKTVVKHNGKQ